jgi:2-phosphosulfolactate phosphatase
LTQCLQAKRVVVAGFVNLDAVAECLLGEREVHIVCAGTDGAVTREDVLLAGALAEKWGLAGAGATGALDDLSDRSNDAARIALAAWRDTGLRPGSDGVSAGASARADWGAELKRSQGGRNLMAIGADADIELAAQSNRFDVVPQFDCQSRRITLG